MDKIAETFALIERESEYLRHNKRDYHNGDSVARLAQGRERIPPSEPGGRRSLRVLFGPCRVLSARADFTEQLRVLR
jgi:hypothetical protein